MQIQKTKMLSTKFRSEIIPVYNNDAAYVSEAGPPNAGERYWNSTDHKMREYNGAAWQDEGSGGGSYFGSLHLFYINNKDSAYENSLSNFYTEHTKRKVNGAKIPSGATWKLRAYVNADTVPVSFGYGWISVYDETNSVALGYLYIDSIGWHWNDVNLSNLPSGNAILSVRSQAAFDHIEQTTYSIFFTAIIIEMSI